MKAVLSSIKRRLDSLPIWAIVLINVGVLGLWFADLDLPDSIPVDKVLITLMLGSSAFYLWRRWFGPPSALAATARRRLAEMETLYQEVKKAAASLRNPGAGSEVLRLATLLEGVKRIELRLEQIELVLRSPQYADGGAAAEVKRLEGEVSSADPKAKHDLEEALGEARKHATNIAAIRATRDQLGAAIEHFYQLFRRIHSQVLGIGLAQSPSGDLSASVDELARALEQYERENEETARAEARLDEELAEDARKRAAQQRLER